MKAKPHPDVHSSCLLRSVTWSSTCLSPKCRDRAGFGWRQGGAVRGQLRFLQAVPQAQGRCAREVRVTLPGWFSQSALRDLFNNYIPVKMCSMGHGFVLFDHAVESLARYIWAGCGKPSAPFLQSSSCWKRQPLLPAAGRNTKLLLLSLTALSF